MKQKISLKYKAVDDISRLKTNESIGLMKKIFYVFRHGETELNVKKVWQGTHSNPNLNDRGREQAAELEQKFALLSDVSCANILYRQANPEQLNDSDKRSLPNTV